MIIETLRESFPSFEGHQTSEQAFGTPGGWDSRKMPQGLPSLLQAAQLVLNHTSTVAVGEGPSSASTVHTLFYRRSQRICTGPTGKSSQ